ncbi:hypothetical protein B0J13DRAFT_564906 [Dactylonectria estremocensis]|uniref:BZIP domain-containing protein n=1 Tax=Dactylonectria estremocensis TaxID=1079267 RepID=A0A9P9IR11_9HYPO|nr:hypothetical protein B0J13DRAFT_564906 [Dactylonectria estremocensis]
METASGMAYLQQMTPQCPATSPSFSPYMAGGDNSTVPLELLYGLDEYAGYQELNLSAMMMASGGGGLVTSPTTPPVTPPMDVIQNNGVKNVRHRTQHREAQRRCREHREQRQQTLQQKVDGIRVMYQALSEEHAKSTIEVARLQKENNMLRSEVKDLHQQWRLTQTVLQWSQQSSQPPLRAGGDAGFLSNAPYCLGDLPDDPSPYHSPS